VSTILTATDEDGGLGIGMTLSAPERSAAVIILVSARCCRARYFGLSNNLKLKQMFIQDDYQSTADTASANVAQARKIILDHLKDYPVQLYLFGSRARGDARPTSDIDVGILPKAPLPTGLLAELREALFESLIPVTVDLVDLSQTDEDFKQQILQDAIIWNV